MYLPLLILIKIYIKGEKIAFFIKYNKKCILTILFFFKIQNNYQNYFTEFNIKYREKSFIYI